MSELENSFFKSVFEFQTLLKENKELNIKLPRVCLMGIPYSGKSLLLSSIIGLDIIPIAQKLQIKRPLELKLNHLNSGSPYAIFEELEKEKITDFSNISDIIQKIQEKKGNYYQPIILNIYSQKYPDMTFIDLPGMTYIPVGACPKSIEEFGTRLSAEYANDELNLLICPIPVNYKSFDEKTYCFKCIENFGESRYRILPVYTKVDLLEENPAALKDFKDFINNNSIPFKFGYVCVKNRTEENLKNNMNLKEAIEEEKKFFEKESPLYGKLPKDKVGYDTLIQKIKKSYFELIKENLIKENINLKELINKTESKEEKKNISEILKFINDNSYSKNDTFNLHEIKLTKQQDKKNLEDLIDFIEENAKDD